MYSFKIHWNGNLVWNGAFGQQSDYLSICIIQSYLQIGIPLNRVEFMMHFRPKIIVFKPYTKVKIDEHKETDNTVDNVFTS